MDFFHLQDLVCEVTSTVKFFTPFEDFSSSPLPQTVREYLDYRQRAIGFIESRNRRIAAYVAEHPPATTLRPVWASPRFEPVLAHAEAVGQRKLLEELLAAGDRLGLFPRPYAASVMFTPPTNKTRMLFTVRPETGGMQVRVSTDAFNKFFARISTDEARRQLEPAEEPRLRDHTAIREFIAALGRLLQPP